MLRFVRFFAVALCFAPIAWAQEPAKETVPIALYDGAGAGGKGPKLLEDKFHEDTEFRITRISTEEIRAGKLKGFKALIVPGGSSSTEGIALGEDGRDMVRNFVKDGGGYVGLCAGCYLATSHYKWSLNILPAKVVDSAHWERGVGKLKLELTGEGREWTKRTDTDVTVVYHNGPVLEPIPDSKEKLIPLAYYREELVGKGAKAGLMVDTPAITAARYGKGWAVGVSPHPEQTDDLKDVVPALLRWTMKNPPKE